MLRIAILRVSTLIAFMSSAVPLNVVVMNVVAPRKDGLKDYPTCRLKGKMELRLNQE
jgi:hypothetical protein